MSGYDNRSSGMFAKVVLALSALTSPGPIASAQTRGEKPQATSPATGDFNSLTLPYAPQISRLTLTSPVAGITLTANSDAKELLEQFDKASRGGAKAPPELVQKLFEQLSLEPGTQIPPERFRALVAQYPESPVRAAMLKFVYYSPHITMSDTTLGLFWGSSNADVLKWALLNQSRTMDPNRQKDFYKNLRGSPIPDIRVATSVALISAGIEPLKLTNNEILKASLLLREEHLSAGHETRLAELLARNIAESGLTKLSTDEVRIVAAPLLHLLQRATKLSPEFANTLLSADTAPFDRFCVSLLKTLTDARNQIGDTVILSKDSRVLVGLHYERDFTHVMLQQLCENLGVTQVKFVKAGNLANGSAGPYGDELEAFPDSKFRREFLSKLEQIKSPEPKQGYMAELQALARDKATPALVWNMMHGSTRQTWFYHGQAGVQVPDELRDPRGISDVEVVEALISNADLSKAELDLSHMTFICDACRQYTFAEGVLDGLERASHQRGVTIQGYPTFVVLTQPYMYGSLFGAVFLEVPEAGDNSGLPKDGIRVGTTLFGPFDKGLRDLGKRDHPILLRDLFVPDSNALAAHRTALKDLNRLGALADAPSRPAGSNPASSSALQTVNTQDPAIFSPVPLSLDAIKKACKESGLSEEGLNGSRKSFFLEVSDWAVPSTAALLSPEVS